MCFSLAACGGSLIDLMGRSKDLFLLAELLAKQTYSAFLSSSKRFLKLRLLSLNFYC